ncbi:hypothetical protein ACS0TY_028238 [Phlomoides rotata]
MVSGAIDDDMTNIIVSQLYLDVVDPTKDIVMYVNSPGGSIKAGMALFDFMRNIWSDVSTICIGLTASMVSFLLSVVTKWKRYSLLNSMIMIHQPLGGVQSSHTDIDIQENAMLHHEATLWGLRMILGELFPYLISRPASLSSSALGALEELGASSKENQVVNHMVAMFHGIVGREIVKVRMPEEFSHWLRCYCYSSINLFLHKEALQNHGGLKTKNVFYSIYWENLNIVVIALDNVCVRIYVAHKYLYFKNPLLESGTLCTKGNAQLISPHLTNNYGVFCYTQEKEASMCALPSFLHNISHFLDRQEFDSLLYYKSVVRNVGDAQARNNLEYVIACSDREKESFQDCITGAHLKFKDYIFPEDATTTELNLHHLVMAASILANNGNIYQVLDGNRVLILDSWGHGSQKWGSIVMNLRARVWEL